MTRTLRSPTGRYSQWPRIIASAQRANGQWIALSYDALLSLANSVRKRRHRDLRRSDGRLQVEVRNDHTVEGVRRGDIYIRWVPTRKD